MLEMIIKGISCICGLILFLIIAYMSGRMFGLGFYVSRNKRKESKHLVSEHQTQII